MHDVAWRGMWICVRSKDAQKQLARTSLIHVDSRHVLTDLQKKPRLHTWLLYARPTASTHPSNKKNHCQPTSTSQSKHQGEKQDVPWRSRQFCCITTHQKRSLRNKKSLHRSASSTNEKYKSRNEISIIWCKLLGNRLSSLLLYVLPLE